MNGQSAHFLLIDECLLLRPETNLHPHITDTVTVRTIVANHLPEDGTLPKQNWMQRWFTNPEPDEQPIEHRIVTATPPDQDAVEETVGESFMDRIVAVQVEQVIQARRAGARDSAVAAVEALEARLESLPNDTMIDTIARAVTQDCIDVVRKLRPDLLCDPSGGE